uniref:Uncharacterized protein n=1 Tax=Panagrellus redivivus TaxID=6233 RepID=A0A7E4UWE8_PANRE
MYVLFGGNHFLASVPVCHDSGFDRVHPPPSSQPAFKVSVVPVGLGPAGSRAAANSRISGGTPEFAPRVDRL